MIPKKASLLSVAGVLLLSIASRGGFAARPDSADRSLSEVPRLHRIVEFDHPLLDAERRELARLGVDLVQPIGARRAVVRATASALAAAAASGIAADAAPIVPAARLHPTAAQELARRGGAARLEVAFHADVPLAEAVERIRGAGAWPVDPLPLRFAPPRNVEVWASSDAAAALAALDAVAIIHAPDGDVEAMNATAASMSKVDVLYAAPYGLSGAGIAVGVVDIGNAQATHPEFEARVTAHSTQSATAAADHPTHVVGTIAAKGVQTGAKGMAPAATVHQYAQSGSFLNELETNVPALSLVAVNNSWGYITGWNYDDTKSQWGWYGRDAFGAYSSTSAGIDQLERETNALVVFSAGNDGNDNGPVEAPWSHVHPGDADGAAIWCVSADKSGTDCPDAPCGNRCETEKHPADGTWGTMSRTASSKNGLGVGALTRDMETAVFSSRGPTRDGRVKPDLVAKGASLYSTIPTGNYKSLQGTSMATPVVTGIAALVVEQWRKTIGGDPGAAALKAILIHGAQDLGMAGPDYRYGWGLVDAKASVDAVLADGGRGDRIVRGAVGSGEGIDYMLDAPLGAPAKLTLVWLDVETTPYPANEITLVNDLDLRVIGPGPTSVSPWVLHPGQVDTPASVGANRRDPVEQVVFTPEIPGAWRATVRAAAVPGGGKQQFVLVSSVPVRSAKPSCFDPYEPNDYAEEAWGRLRDGKRIETRLCDATDADYFWFAPDANGSATIRVSSAAPLRATLVAPNGSVTSRVISAGSATLSALVREGRYVLKVAPEGTLASEAAYTVETAFPSSLSPRGRPVRR